MKIKKTGFITSSRADYNIIKPLLKKVLATSDLELELYVTGMHLSSQFGLTLEEIKKDNIEISATVDMLLASDTPTGISQSMGLGTIGFAGVYERLQPDIVVVVGDRFEMHSAAVAAVPFNIPIAHLRGGELTYGAIDEQFRHSLTKISHLHFPVHEPAAHRIRQMGEEEWRITVSGDPGLEHIHQEKLYTREELEENFPINLSQPTLLVTLHPVTREYQKTGIYIDNLLNAVAEFNKSHCLVFTYPNADTSGRIIIEAIEAYCQKHKHAFAVPSFGAKGYYSMMTQASAMVGNSSSGIWEAASFGLPVVNIGSRQDGRLRPANVIDTATTTQSITQGIRKALSPPFNHSLENIQNPYYKENASTIIIETLRDTKIDERLLIKRFPDNNNKQEISR